MSIAQLIIQVISACYVLLPLTIWTTGPFPEGAKPSASVTPPAYLHAAVSPPLLHTLGFSANCVAEPLHLQ